MHFSKRQSTRYAAACEYSMPCYILVRSLHRSVHEAEQIVLPWASVLTVNTARRHTAVFNKATVYNALTFKTAAC